MDLIVGFWWWWWLPPSGPIPNHDMTASTKRVLESTIVMGAHEKLEIPQTLQHKEILHTKTKESFLFIFLLL